jgi:hypothetical protein
MSGFTSTATGFMGSCINRSAATIQIEYSYALERLQVNVHHLKHLGALLITNLHIPSAPVTIVPNARVQRGFLTLQRFKVFGCGYVGRA